MGERTIIVCDLCEMDGEENILAIARYTDTTGKEWLVCKKHLESVKEANLPYLLLKDE